MNSLLKHSELLGSTGKRPQTVWVSGFGFRVLGLRTALRDLGFELRFDSALFSEAFGSQSSGAYAFF